MKKWLIILGLLPIASSAMANTPESLTIGYNYTDYSSYHGNKNIVFADLKNRLDHGAFILGVAQGNRDYERGETFDAARGKATLWYNWNPVLSTRTGVSFGSNSPVFVRREILNDFNLKFIKNVIMTIGGRHAQYYGGTEVNSWSAGWALYTGNFITTYRYTHYDTIGKGNSESYLFSLRKNDNIGKGNTQIWLSTGTGAYTYDWTPETRNGKLRTFSIKRIQPMTDNINLSLVLGKQWFDTPVQSYSGINGQIGVEWGW